MVGSPTNWGAASLSDLKNEWVIWVVGICLAIAAPLQIVSTQNSLFTIFARQRTNITVSLVNGCYDSSAIMFTLVGCALLPSKTNSSDGSTHRSQVYSYPLVAYAVFALLQIPVILWLYPTQAEMEDEQQRAQRAQRIEPQEHDSTGDDVVCSDDIGCSEDQTLVAECVQDVGYDAVESGTPVMDGTEDTKPEEIADDSFCSPGRKSQEMSLFWSLVDRDYLFAMLWFACQFFTFTYFAQNCTDYYADSVNEYVGFTYPFSLVTALIIGTIFAHVPEPNYVIFITTVVGTVFQTLTVLISGGIGIEGNLGWILQGVLCLFRSCLFSSLWIYLPSVPLPSVLLPSVSFKMLNSNEYIPQNGRFKTV